MNMKQILDRIDTIQVGLLNEIQKGGIDFSNIPPMDEVAMRVRKACKTHKKGKSQ